MKNRHVFKSVIFDFDGTLIDSSPSILECFARVLEEAGLQPLVPLDKSLIGPPLCQTLKNLTGLPDGDALEGLAANFRKIYDMAGYRATRVYPGVEDLLSKLDAHEIPMAIATNKRLTPTLKILDHLGWKKYFQLAATLDTPGTPHDNKASLIRSVLDDMGGDASKSLYLGDKWEDGEAAAANGMRFIAAGWGYGNWGKAKLPLGWYLIQSPHELAEQLDVLFSWKNEFYSNPVKNASAKSVCQ